MNEFLLDDLSAVLPFCFCFFRGGYVHEVCCVGMSFLCLVIFFFLLVVLPFHVYYSCVYVSALLQMTFFSSFLAFTLV